MPNNRIGLIGAGLVGQALAERWYAAGWEVVGCDIDPARREQLRTLTGQVAQNASEVVAACDITVLSLPTSPIASAVLQALDVPLTGKVIVDTTTGEPDEMAAQGLRLSQLGAGYLDATIAGSSAQVRAGEVVVMVGGEAETLARCSGVLDSFAARTFHVGPWGSGARMKLVVNLVLGLNRAVVAEGLQLARKMGLDGAVALDILRAGPAYSRVMDVKAEKMLSGNFEPQARLAQHWKDVGLILAAGEQCSAALPLSTIHERLLAELVARGYGELDNSAIINAFGTEQSQAQA